MIAGNISVWSGIKGAITSIANAIKMALRIVPIPGSSRKGIQRKRTKTLTINVDIPTVKSVCSVIPWARTVHGLTPIPASINIASPVPKIHNPKTRKNSVMKRGFRLRGVSELQTVLGTLWAGLINSSIDFSDKLAHIS